MIPAAGTPSLQLNGAVTAHQLAP